MRRDPVNGDPVMLIPEHKRSVDRQAMLALDEELVDLLAIYVEHINPQFPSPQDNYLFLQSSGKPFSLLKEFQHMSRLPSKTFVCVLVAF